MSSPYETANKRMKTDDSSKEDRFKPNPSPCVHVRALSDQAIEGDLVEAVQHFGAVRDVLMMPSKRQALVEFENLDGARNCVQYGQTAPIYCAGQPAFFNYSTSEHIKRPGEADDSKPVNHVLLFTILNPQFSITVDVLHKITSPYGQVRRIVIFKKNGVQAMVEFDSVETAKMAKQNLNGADIYSGCCTLKIEYAKPARLNVSRNTEDCHDYTNPNLQVGGKDGPRPGQPLLQEPRGFGGGPSGFNGSGGPGGAGGFGGGFGGAPGGGYFDEPGYDGFGGGPRNGGPFGGGPGGPPGGFGGPRGGPLEGEGFGRPRFDGGMQGAVAMVYGLNMEKMNCDKVFNLFCLYGNIIRIKFLKSKEGSAMVQLGDGISVQRAMENLNNVHFFGNKLSVAPSKQQFLQEVHNPYELPDGTPSYKDFMGNRNNRFNSPEAAQKNRIQSPSHALHFFNAPPGIDQEHINEIFDKAVGKTPNHMKMFPTKSERSCTGLVAFDDTSDGIEALVMANHTPVQLPGNKTPFIFKLCFSTMPGQYSGGGHGGGHMGGQM